MQRMATSKHITLIIAFAADDGSGQHPGGVLLLLDNKNIDYKKTLYNEDGFVMVEAEWGGERIEIAGVYAPVTNHGTVKADFFDNLKGKITEDTLIGGDWNCVPDVTLDVVSSNPLGYTNKGASNLAAVMSEVGLVDERREQLGNETEVTRRGITRAGVTGSAELL